MASRRRWSRSVNQRALGRVVSEHAFEAAEGAATVKRYFKQIPKVRISDGSGELDHPPVLH